MKPKKNRRFALNALRHRKMWHFWGFYDPEFGWFKFGAGYWLKYLLTR